LVCRFHLAGVGSKNVTQGVPRIQELIDVSKHIKKPVTTAYLQEPTRTNCEELIRSLPGLKLTAVVASRHVEEAPDPATAQDPHHQGAVDLYRVAFAATAEADDECGGRVVLVLELEMRRMRQHALVPADVKRALDRLYNRGPRLLEVIASDACQPKWFIRLRLLGAVRDMADRLPTEHADRFQVHLMQRVGDHVVEATLVSGVTGVNEASIRETTRRVVGRDGAAVDEKTLVVDAAGTSLAKLLALPGIDATRTCSNDTLEVHAVLGIEAAAATLASELSETLGFDGGYINTRHITTVMNTMTCRGFLMQLSRHGINRVEKGPLVRCSFEETVDTLFDAACFGEFDEVQGVTTSLMLGQLCPIGTGTMDVLDGADEKPAKRVLRSRYRRPQTEAKQAGIRVVHSRMAYQHRCDDGIRVPTLAMCRPQDLGDAPPAKRTRCADELVFGNAGELDRPFMDPDTEDASGAVPLDTADTTPEFLLGRQSLNVFLQLRS
jgi:DNA-directed RNA polymerase II subunit RPB1